MYSKIWISYPWLDAFRRCLLGKTQNAYGHIPHISQKAITIHTPKIREITSASQGKNTLRSTKILEFLFYVSLSLL